MGKASSFKECQFEGDAILREAHFDAPVSFAGARFQANADFSAFQSKVVVVLANAEFKAVPNFLEASFLEPPRLDNMVVADPVKRFHKWKDASVSDPRRFLKFMRVCTDPDTSVKYRRLKKLAFEAQDTGAGAGILRAGNSVAVGSGSTILWGEGRRVSGSAGSMAAFRISDVR